MTAAEDTPLILTKLNPPPPSARTIARPRLFARLDEAWQPACRLILVSAPAGYGKSTLVANWLQQAVRQHPERRFGWLTLEPADNDPLRFFAYLSAALQCALPGAGQRALSILQSGQTQARESAFADLLNDLATVRGEIVLVLDDYQAIHSPQIHQGMSELIEHLPAQVKLVTTSRSDPPLALHRLRARGQMVELRLDDLRFSPDEAAEFIAASAGLELARQDILTLTQRTEGWIAGIQMAMLSLRSQSDASGFIQRLAGSNRYVLDYLTEEALASQSPEVQTFLLRTSILNRLCAENCDAVLAAAPGGSFPSSQAVLEYLAQANLFIQPLDEERRWFRYHALFADLLQIRLNQGAGGILPADLHRRAASWAIQQGSISDAIHHSVQAGDFDTAAMLIEQHTLTLFAQGRLQQLLSWVSSLPPVLTTQRPFLAIYQAWTLAFAARFAEVAPLLEQVQAQLASGAVPPADQPALVGELYALNKFLALTSGDPRRLAECFDVDLEIIPAERQFARSVARWVQGYIHRLQGNLPAAIAAFEEVLAIGRKIDNTWTILSAAVDLGMALRLSGQLDQAEFIFREALDLVQQVGPASYGFAGRLEAFLANCLCEKNELSAAVTMIELSIAHNQLWENPNHSAYAFVTQARLLLALGQTEAAAAALQRAQTVVDHQPVIGNIIASLRGMRVRLALQTPDPNAWPSLLARQESAAQTSAPDEIHAVDILSRARLLLALQEPATALAMLAPLEEEARARHNISLLIEILTLKSRLMGETGRGALAEALHFGLPAGYRRIFLDEGPALEPDLRSLRQHPEPPLSVAEARLIAELLPAANAASSPLSAREQEVLQAIAAGHTNAEIAAQLFVSLGTVKAHSAAIFRKLDAANRTEAVARAREAGWL